MTSISTQLSSSQSSLLTPEIISQHGFTDDEYKKLLSIMGREPNLVELGIFSVMWSEHCSYKSTRKHLMKLPTTGKCVICGPGENAGVIDIGDNQAAVFKMESHNHPSFIEPYQGAATGVGGIMRDIFTMGARPIANLNALRFGELSHPKTKHLISGVVAGISGYGNCMGVPTVGGECDFDSSYNENNIVNAMCIGLADADKIFYSAASQIGANVLYAGSKTGRDGIHGATMASAEFDEGIEEKRPTVQVGDPFAEKLVMEACFELMKEDAIMAIQDMGAAGLTCSSLEMADKGGAGIELILDDVPTREDAMTPYEIMLSESQERMLMVIKPGREDVAKRIFDKWEVPNAIIGKITDTGRMILKFKGDIVADLPVSPLSDDAPLYDRPWVPTQKHSDLTLEDSAVSYSELMDKLKHLLATPNLTSKKWIWEQYDNMVMNDTIEPPGGDAAIVRIHNTSKALAMTSDCTPRYCYADPIEGGKQAVAETWRNITAVGGTPLAITNCLNFGNPEKPEIMGQIVGCLAGMKEACEFLDYPIISGNVSLYNETNGDGIKPTPAIGGVGILMDYSKYTTMDFKNEGDTIIRIGDMDGHLGMSLYAQEFLGDELHSPPPVNLEVEKRHGDFIRMIISNGWVSACHDVSDGGQLVAIAKMAIRGNIGAKVDIAADISRVFGEDQGRYIITTSPEMAERILTSAPEKNITATAIGEVGGSDFTVGSESISIKELQKLNLFSI